MNTSTPPIEQPNNSIRQISSICIPFCEDSYADLVKDPILYRKYLDQTFKDHPELFPPEIINGYKMKDRYFSIKCQLWTRRISIKGSHKHYSIRPSFVMPYMTGKTKEVENGLFLRKFAVPYWATAQVYGKNAMYWYRLENQLGRNSLVGTTIKDPDKLPEHILADEKHTRLVGEKHYIAMTVSNECILGSSVTCSAGEQDLTKAYSVFKEEACQVKSDYAPETVNTDGWAATQKAWKAIFSTITVICCFLHVYIKIQDRGKKRYQDVFFDAASKLWDCYNAENKRSFSQRVRRLVIWAENNILPDVFVKVFKKLVSLN